MKRHVERVGGTVQQGLRSGIEAVPHPEQDLGSAAFSPERGLCHTDTSARSRDIVLFCLWRAPDDLSPMGIAALCYPGSEGGLREGSLSLGLRRTLLAQSCHDTTHLWDDATALRRFGAFCGPAQAWGTGDDIAGLSSMRASSALAPSPHAGGFLDICVQPCQRVWAERFCAARIFTPEAALCALRHLASGIRSQARISHPFPCHTPFR